MPIRLVFLIRDLGAGGAQRQLVALARTLAAERQFTVSVVHFYGGGFERELRDAGVETVCVGKRHRWDLIGFSFRLITALRALRPNILHGYLNEANLMALILKPLCGWPKVVWGVRDSQTDAAHWGILGKLSYRLTLWFSRYANLAIANSQAGRRHYLEQGYPEKKTVVVPNGIDTERFQPVPAGNLRVAWGGDGRFLVGVIGRLNPMKDHRTFLEAAALAAKVRPELRFVIVGDGDPEYASRLRTLASELGIADRVVWSHSRKDMPEVYAALDLVVSSSAFGEGFSNVLAEAMACGRPCVTTDVGDSAWLVDDASRVVPANNAPALAAVIRSVAAMTPAQREALGATARSRVEQNFAVSAMTQKTAQLLDAMQPPEPVTFITTGLGTGGAEMMLWQMVTRLDRRRFSPAVLSLTAGGKYRDMLEAEGIPVTSLDMPAGKATVGGVVKLIRTLWHRRPSILVGWMYHGCFVATMARLLLPWRVRLLWSIRQSLYSLDKEKRGSAMVIRALGALSWLPNMICYNSRKSAEQHEALGYCPRKRRLVLNGFDLERWQMKEPGDRRPDDLGILNGATLVGRFGRDALMKDHPSFLKAAALMAQEDAHLHFVLAGTGMDNTNKNLTETVVQLGLRDRVHLLGERDDLPELTRALNLAVSSSAFGEGFPNVVAEAMASGVPVVATDIGDTGHVLGNAGRLVPAQDPEALARACLEVLRLPAKEREALGQLGRQRIEENFSLRAAVEQLEGLMA